MNHQEEEEAMEFTALPQLAGEERRQCNRTDVDLRHKASSDGNSTTDASSEGKGFLPSFLGLVAFFAAVLPASLFWFSVGWLVGCWLADQFPQWTPYARRAKQRLTREAEHYYKVDYKLVLRSLFMRRDTTNDAVQATDVD